jgi:RHS repeat-associated protein
VSTPDLSQQWDLDATGNWSTVTTDDDPQARDHNAANEVTSADDWANPKYDRAGNMILVASPTEAVPDRALWCTYDAWNRMTASYLDDGDGVFEPGTGDTQVGAYAYDALNRRTSKTAEGATTHFYLSEQNQVLEERTGTDAFATVQNVWGQRYVDDLVLRDRDTSPTRDGVSDERFYALQDANWNMVALFDASSGEVAERYTYTAYGKCEVRMDDFEPAVDNESAYDWRSLYTTRELDPETGLYYYRARYYDADMGRFVGRDPILYAAMDLNLYGYADDSPIGSTDPTGEYTISKECGKEQSECLRLVLDKIVEVLKAKVQQMGDNPNQMGCFAKTGVDGVNSYCRMRANRALLKTIEGTLEIKCPPRVQLNASADPPNNPCLVSKSKAARKGVFSPGQAGMPIGCPDTSPDSSCDACSAADRKNAQVHIAHNVIPVGKTNCEKNINSILSSSGKNILQLLVHEISHFVVGSHIKSAGGGDTYVVDQFHREDARNLANDFLGNCKSSIVPL